MNWTARARAMPHLHPEDQTRRQTSEKVRHPALINHHPQAIDLPHQAVLQRAQPPHHTHP
jgi:hypothetical protein